jgi:hypothetical protein
MKKVGEQGLLKRKPVMLSVVQSKMMLSDKQRRIRQHWQSPLLSLQKILFTTANMPKMLKNLDLLLRKYFFDPHITGTSKMKNAQLVVAVEECLEIYKASRFEV